MINRSVDAETQINCPSEKVISFIGDVRNREKYVSALKSITLNEGGDDPSAQKWNWQFDIMGLNLEGTAQCTKYDAGKSYEFATQGGAQSTWRYTAEAAGEGTKLSLHVDYSLPDEVLSHLPAGSDPDQLEQAEAQKVFRNLKAILEG